MELHCPYPQAPQNRWPGRSIILSAMAAPNPTRPNPVAWAPAQHSAPSSAVQHWAQVLSRHLRSALSYETSHKYGWGCVQGFINNLPDFTCLLSHNSPRHAAFPPPFSIC